MAIVNNLFTDFFYVLINTDNYKYDIVTKNLSIQTSMKRGVE